VNDDSELVRQTLAGDHEAFGQLYDRYARYVRAIVVDVARTSEAIDDCTQEVFLRAFRKLASLKDASRFGPWLAGIARLVVSELRRSKRYSELPESMSYEPPTWDDEAELIHKMVDELPEEERLAVRFFFLNERSIDETARLLDRSRSGTYALLQSAKSKLALKLKSPI
jgi:RNA polymerase sigma-70 factor, ECF subfamily